MPRNKIIKRMLYISLLLIFFILGQISIVVINNYKTGDIKPNIPAHQDEIIQIANNYLRTASYSEEGLIKALHEYEYFDEDIAREAVESLDVDWEKQAEKEIDEYLHMDGYSEKGIREALRKDLFEEEDIDKAIENMSPDWSSQAKRKKESLLQSGVSETLVIPTLLKKGFTQEDVFDL